MTNKKKYFIGNWKMFGDFRSLKIIKKIHFYLAKHKKYQKKYKVVMCIPNTLISFFSSKLKSKYVHLGAQNCHHKFEEGPFTGSVNARMLKNAGAKYIILGHSENRLEGDTDQIIKKKIQSALKNNLIIIFCIGETHKEKRKGKTFIKLKKQINNSIGKKFDSKKIVVAYEPVWSIGTGKIPTPNDLIKIFKFIKRELIKKSINKSSPIVLYGGSVNNNNINIFSSILEIDGFLIGGASQSPKKFIDIIKNYYK